MLLLSVQGLPTDTLLAIVVFQRRDSHLQVGVEQVIIRHARLPRERCIAILVGLAFLGMLVGDLLVCMCPLLRSIYRRYLDDIVRGLPGLRFAVDSNPQGMVERSSRVLYRLVACEHAHDTLSVLAARMTLDGLHRFGVRHYAVKSNDLVELLIIELERVLRQVGVQNTMKLLLLEEHLGLGLRLSMREAGYHRLLILNDKLVQLLDLVVLVLEQGLPLAVSVLDRLLTHCHRLLLLEHFA